MIVKYTTERNYDGDGKDPNLTLGNNYLVLSINFLPKDYSWPSNVCVQRDSDGTPSLFDISFFTIVDKRIPDGWYMKDMDKNYFRLEPVEFDGDFWELYHDGDEKAECIFANVLEKTKKFHNINYI